MVTLEPAEGTIQIKFLDDEDDNSLDADKSTLEYALVLSAGKKTNVKAGDVVLVECWARSSPKLDDGSQLISSWYIKAKVKA